MKKYWIVFLCFLLVSCGNAQQSVPNRYVDLESVYGQLYRQQIQPLLDKRCVVCHGCYDAPCQLNLASAQGIDRGANPQVIYNGKRLTADPMTRLFEDAHSVSDWREKGFFSVLGEKQDSLSFQDNLIYRMLELKQANPLSNDASNNQVIPDGLFNLSLSASNVCTGAEQFDSYAETHPSWECHMACQVLNLLNLNF